MDWKEFGSWPAWLLAKQLQQKHRRWRLITKTAQSRRVTSACRRLLPRRRAVHSTRMPIRMVSVVRIALFGDTTLAFIDLAHYTVSIYIYWPASPMSAVYHYSYCTFRARRCTWKWILMLSSLLRWHLNKSRASVTFLHTWIGNGLLPVTHSYGEAFRISAV